VAHRNVVHLGISAGKVNHERKIQRENENANLTSHLNLVLAREVKGLGVEVVMRIDVVGRGDRREVQHQLGQSHYINQQMKNKEESRTHTGLLRLAPGLGGSVHHTLDVNVFDQKIDNVLPSVAQI
jgi:hypothetical protein